MNILLINHYAGSPMHGMEYRPYYLAKEWIKAGHEVTIIAASYSHLRTQNPELVSGNLEEDINGIRYIWLKTPYYQGNGLKRIFNILTFVFRLAFYLRVSVKKTKYDVVITSSTYPLDLYPARIIKRHNKAKLIFEVHDLWPLSPMELGNIPPWHPFIVVMQKAENDSYKDADQVVSLLPNALEHMAEHGLNPNKFNYIPNGIDLDEWRIDSTELPEVQKSILNELKEQAHFIVGYAGSHGNANSLDSLVEAGMLLKENKVDIVLVGWGPEKERLEQLVKDHEISNVIFLPPVEKRSVPQLLKYFDAVYMGAPNNSLYRFGVSPNKLMDYMMAGRPVIYAIEAANDPVTESGCGISIPAESPEALVEAIIQLINTPELEREKMGDQGRKFVLSNHNYQELADNFIKIMGN